MVLLDDRPKRIIPESEYQDEYRGYEILKEGCLIERCCVPVGLPCKEYRGEDILKEGSIIKRRRVPAGLPSKGKPEYDPEEYDSSDGIVPPFGEKSTARSTYIPQPDIDQIPSYKPSSETETAPSKVFLLEPRMTEVDSYSHYVHCPMPQELVRQTAPTTPLWVKELHKPYERTVRYDLTSSYQADFCGVQTQPRRICLKKNSEGKLVNNTDFTKSQKEYKLRQNQKLNATKDEIDEWNYAHSLLFRTTYNSSYLPPSIHGLICHPTMYPPSEE